MTLAEQAKQACSDSTAFTLYGAYALKCTRETVKFAHGVNELEKRNDKGRVIKSRWRYADNSVLEYVYSEANETYKLKASA
jgi:hypothetical protein